MNVLRSEMSNCSERRQRLHELLIALIRQQDGIELIEEATDILQEKGNYATELDPAKWLDRNKRIIKKYQSLVRSAIALDALLDSERIE